MSVWASSSVLYIHGPELAALVGLPLRSLSGSLVSQRIGDLCVGLRLSFLRVLQNHQRRRPVVPQRTFRLREGDRNGGPALERSGLERLDQGLRFGGLRRLDRLREHECVSERIERGVDRRLVELLLIFFREPLPDIAEL